MQITQEQAIQTEWRPEDAGTGRSARVLSIEELRARLGLTGAERQAARAEPPTEERTRPRIVRRHEALAG